MTFKHLLVIGQGKSGTTWLQHLFDHNKNSFVLFYDQELNYFTEKHPDSFSYKTYIEYFKPSVDDRRWICEVTPTYFSRPLELIPRIKPLFQLQSNPNPRIIVILRDPVRRSYSDYLQKLRYSKIPKGTTFLDSLSLLPSILKKSFYCDDLLTWCDAFGRENILVLFHHDLVEQPLKVVKSIEEFLSMSIPLEAAYAGVKVNSTGLVSSRLLMSARINIAFLLRRIGLNRILHALKLSPFGPFINSLFYRPSPKLSLLEEQMLRPIFQNDIRKLDDFLGQNSSLLRRWLA